MLHLAAFASKLQGISLISWSVDWSMFKIFVAEKYSKFQAWLCSSAEDYRPFIINFKYQLQVQLLTSSPTQNDRRSSSFFVSPVWWWPIDNNSFAQRNDENERSGEKRKKF